jgi:hypothetical protein
MNKLARAGALVVLAGLVVTGVTAASMTGSKIVGGPFVVRVTSQSATIAWVVQNDEVTLRPQDGAAAIASPVYRVEKTTLTSLKPNTRYDYNIASEGDDGKGSFKTPPFGPGIPFSFVVYGDNRTRPDVHQKVIAELLKHGIPDFVLQTGDMVANGNDSSLWPIFFGIEKELLRQTAFFPALGNHERNTPYFSEFFQESEPYYSFDWGNAHFTVLDSDLINMSADEQKRNALWNEETRWLEEDLQHHQDATFRFVAAHHPPITAVARRQNDNPHMTALIPLFEKYRVTAGFFGHDHNYQHYLKGGIHYVTTGGGGAPLYDVNQPPEEITRKVASIENFVTVQIDGRIARLEAISIDGSVLDSFVIEQPAVR